MGKISAHVLLIIFICLIISFLCSCTYDKAFPDCTEHAIEGGNWERYHGEKLPPDCFWILLKTEWRAETYFDLSGSCVDMVSIPSRCDGTPLCFSFSDPILDTFRMEATEWEIIGIREE